MKATVTQIQKGMKIQCCNLYPSKKADYELSCGTIKPNSPIYEVLDIDLQPQSFVGLNAVIVTTNIGTIRMSTRQKVNIV